MQSNFVWPSEGLLGSVAQRGGGDCLSVVTTAKALSVLPRTYSYEALKVQPKVGC